MAHITSTNIYVQNQQLPVGTKLSKNNEKVGTISLIWHNHCAIFKHLSRTMDLESTQDDQYGNQIKIWNDII